MQFDRDTLVLGPFTANQDEMVIIYIEALGVNKILVLLVKDFVLAFFFSSWFRGIFILATACCLILDCSKHTESYLVLWLSFRKAKLKCFRHLCLLNLNFKLDLIVYFFLRVENLVEVFIELTRMIICLKLLVLSSLICDVILTVMLFIKISLIHRLS